MPSNAQELTHGARVIQRVNRAMSAYHADFGEPIDWGDIARLLDWTPSTQSRVSTGKRPLTVLELVIIGTRLAASVGWLAAEEGAMRSGQPPVRYTADAVPEFLGELTERPSAPRRPAAKSANHGRKK